MKPKIIVIVILISLCFFFGFNKISNYKNNTNNSNIAELKIFRYLPKNNKLLFISNFKSSNILNNIRTNFDQNNQDELSKLKKNILAYLGINLGKNKLIDIYDNELLISTYENKENSKDDILIVFKIKPQVKLNDILNISNEISQTDQVFTIYRKNKINYLNFIYKTNDDYIIASSNKELISESLNSNNSAKINYSKEILINFNKENNILFKEAFSNKSYISNETSPKYKGDQIATIFNLKGKDLILKSYLVNNKKDLNISSYGEFLNQNINDNYQISVYDNLRNSFKYLKPVIGDFEKDLLKDLNQNPLILISDKEWAIVYKNYNYPKINNIKKLEDFQKYIIKKNDYMYSIYSKNILKEKEDIIKKISYEDIFTIESDDLFIISNHLITDKNIDLIKKKFLKLNNIDSNTIFYKEIDLKYSDLNKNKYLSYLDNLNFIFENKMNFSTSNYKELSKQSIPEINPLLFKERTLSIF